MVGRRLRERFVTHLIGDYRLSPWSRRCSHRGSSLAVPPSSPTPVFTCDLTGGDWQSQELFTLDVTTVGSATHVSGTLTF